MHIDPLLPQLVIIAIGIFAAGLVFRLLNQPYVVGYLIAGLALGPAGFAVVADADLITHLGALGVTLLLFFIGMEAEPKDLIAHWKVAVIGTLLQIGVSVLTVWAVGQWLEWPLGRILLLGFVLSLSSTAVVLTLLQNSGELRSHAGHISVGILLAQDFAVVPMIIILGLLGGDEPDAAVLTMQGIGGVALMAVVIWAFRGKHNRLPLPAIVRKDGELQIFVALILAFGLAWLSGVLHLSAALGAFVAGLAVAAARETYWLRRRLEPFHIVMVALFFVSVGMLIDFDFLLEHWWKVLLLVIVVLLSNTFLTALVLRMLGERWSQALYVGAMLGQIGEFSFVLAALGKSGGLISDFAYQMTLAVIVLSLMASAPWIALWRRLLHVSKQAEAETPATGGTSQPAR